MRHSGRAMQNAWRFVTMSPSRALKEAKGIGTPATRAEIIKGLKRRTCCGRRQLVVPTPAGLKLFDCYAAPPPRWSIPDHGSLEMRLYDVVLARWLPRRHRRDRRRRPVDHGAPSTQRRHRRLEPASASPHHTRRSNVDAEPRCDMQRLLPVSDPEPPPAQSKERLAPTYAERGRWPPRAQAASIRPANASDTRMLAFAERLAKTNGHPALRLCQRLQHLPALP